MSTDDQLKNNLHAHAWIVFKVWHSTCKKMNQILSLFSDIFCSYPDKQSFLMHISRCMESENFLFISYFQGLRNVPAVFCLCDTDKHLMHVTYMKEPWKELTSLFRKCLKVLIQRLQTEVWRSQSNQTNEWKSQI